MNARDSELWESGLVLVKAGVPALLTAAQREVLEHFGGRRLLEHAHAAHLAVKADTREVVYSIPIPIAWVSR